MLRYLAGVASALLLVAAGLVWWRGGAQAVSPVPQPVAAQRADMSAPPVADDAAPPQATERTREQKRFDRYDHDRDGIVSREEWLATRRKAFSRLDSNGDGRLSFEEWAAKTIGRFAAADGDKSATLTRAEFAATKIVRRTQARRTADCPPQATPSSDDGES